MHQWGTLQNKKKRKKKENVPLGVIYFMWQPVGNKWGEVNELSQSYKRWQTALFIQE